MWLDAPGGPSDVRERLTAAGLVVRGAPRAMVVRCPFTRWSHAEAVLAFVSDGRAEAVVRLAWWARLVFLGLPLAIVVMMVGAGTALADGSVWRAAFYAFVVFTFCMDIRTARRDLAAMRRDVGEAVTGTR